MAAVATEAERNVGGGRCVAHHQVQLGKIPESWTVRGHVRERSQIICLRVRVLRLWTLTANKTSKVVNIGEARRSCGKWIPIGGRIRTVRLETPYHLERHFGRRLARVAAVKVREARVRVRAVVEKAHHSSK